MREFGEFNAAAESCQVTHREKIQADESASMLIELTVQASTWPGSWVSPTAADQRAIESYMIHYFNYLRVFARCA